MEFTREELIYIGLIGAGVGLVLGLIPLIVAIRKKSLRMGVLALLLSAVLGGLGFVYFGGVLPSIIIVVLFTWRGLKRSSSPKNVDAPKPADSSSK